jgi:hypothetical protein
MYNTIINKVAKELDLDPTLIRKVYKNYWLCIREHIKPLPLKEDLSEEEFNSLKRKILSEPSEPAKPQTNTYSAPTYSAPTQQHYSNPYSNPYSNEYTHHQIKPSRVKQSGGVGLKVGSIVTIVLSGLFLFLSLVLLLSTTNGGGDWYSRILASEYVAWCGTGIPVVTIIFGAILNGRGENCGKGFIIAGSILLSLLIIMDSVATYYSYLYLF